MLQLFESTPVGFIGKPKPLQSAVCSFMVHATAFLLVASLVYSPHLSKLPAEFAGVLLVAPQPPPPPPPAPLRVATATPGKQVIRAFSAKLLAPVAIPIYDPSKDTTIEAPPQFALAEGVPGGVPGGIPGGVAGGAIGGVLAALPPPIPVPIPVQVRLAPAPEPVVKAIPERITVPAEIQEAQLLDMPPLPYPPLAKKARIQGTVCLAAIIGRDGKIVEAKILEGHPLLAPMALAAIAHWRYRPTLLRGMPVEVVTQIVVRYRLTT